MSLASILNNIKDKKSGKVTVLDYLDTECVKKPAKFSYRQVQAKLKKVSEILKDDSLSAATKKDLFWMSFMDLYDTVYAPPSRAKVSFHPSSLKDDCPRKLFYEMSEIPPSDPDARVIDPLTQRIFDTGTWWHTYVQGILKRAGVLVQMEVPVVSEELRISGSADGKLLLDRLEYLLEIKTINAWAFQKLVRPKPEHIYQASLYANILGIAKIVFLYINKNTSEIKEFIIDTSMSDVKDAKRKIKEVLTAVEVGKAPERICKDSYAEKAITCTYCTHCFSSKK